MKLAVDIRQRWLADSLTIASTNAVPAKMESSVVIPGRAEGASPESILTRGRYGFRAPSLRSGPGITAEDWRNLIETRSGAATCRFDSFESHC